MSTESIVISDLEGKITDVNKATLRMYGTDDSADLLGKSSFHLIAPEDREEALAGMEEMMQKGYVKDQAYHVVTKDGSRVPVEMSASIMNDVDGKPIGLVGVTRDITERVRAEETERKHYHNIELLSEAAMGFVEFPPDKDIYRFIGEHLKKLTGESIVVINSIDEAAGILTTRAALGMSEFSNRFIKLLGRHPEEMTYNAEDINLSYLSDGRLHDYREGLYGIFLQTIPKPACRALEKLYNVNKIYTIGFMKEKKLLGTAVVILPKGNQLENQEIIETFIKQASIAIQHRRAEEALRESEKRYRTFIETSHEIIQSVKPDGHFDFVNKAWHDILGYTKRELSKLSLFDVVHPESLDYCKKMFKKVLAGESVKNAEAKFMAKDGSTVFVEGNVTRRYIDGKLVAIHGFFRDITARKQAEKQLRLSFIQLAETVSRAMESQDPYTAGHQRQVAELARMVGEKLGFEQDRLQGLYIGGLLHDIGKISIPAEILTHPGKLSDAEWTLIRTHPRRGYEILKHAKFPWPVAEIALHHHEQLDGSGYPDGLKGNELSLAVRILAVCDVVDAMSSHRPYRSARSKEEVIEELRSGKGTKYDSKVVDVLLEILANGELDQEG